MQPTVSFLGESCINEKCKKYRVLINNGILRSEII